MILLASALFALVWIAWLVVYAESTASHEHAIEGRRFNWVAADYADADWPVGGWYAAHSGVEVFWDAPDWPDPDAPWVWTLPAPADWPERAFLWMDEAPLLDTE